MIFGCSANSDCLNPGRAGPRWRACLAVLLASLACSCQRSQVAVQVDEAKAALKEQQTRLELLRKEQGKSGTPTALPASQNWHLQNLQKRLTEGKALETGLAGQKTELERAVKELEALRADYLRQHGGNPS